MEIVRSHWALTQGARSAFAVAPTATAATTPALPPLGFALLLGRPSRLFCRLPGLAFRLALPPPVVLPALVARPETLRAPRLRNNEVGPKDTAPDDVLEQTFDGIRISTAEIEALRASVAAAARGEGRRE